MLGADVVSRNPAPLAVAPPVDAEGFDADDWPVRRVLAPAAGTARPVTTAVVSVWAMAEAAKAAKALKGGRFGRAEGFSPAPPGKVGAVTRDDGITRCTGSRYPADRWDDERQQRERDRRARQRPPKPSKKARTRGKKLLELIGENVE